MRNALLPCSSSAASAPRHPTAHADVYRAKPKLVVVLVIDQFRGDYLDRYPRRLQDRNGFNLFLKRGAWFTDCYYDYANTMTAPGHSTIGTGAYTDGHGISLNEWWDLKRSTTHPVTSVEDERYAIVGDPGLERPRSLAAQRASLHPRRRGRACHPAAKSKLFGISLKDRAAILTSGHASNGAFWLDHASGKFVTSTYWVIQLPAWAQAFNNSDRARTGDRTKPTPSPAQFYDDVGQDTCLRLLPARLRQVPRSPANRWAGTTSPTSSPSASPPPTSSATRSGPTLPSSAP